MAQYANGIKFTESRALEADEFEQLSATIRKNHRMYSVHWMVGRYTFFGCAALILLERTYTALRGNPFPDSGSITAVFCAVLLPFVGSIQELVIPGSRWAQGAFALLYLGFAVSLLALPPGADVLSGLGAWCFGLGMALGWILLLARWSDGKKYGPTLRSALQDLQQRSVDVYVEHYADDSTARLTLEVLPSSHVIYRANGRNWLNKWAKADVLELEDPGVAREFLAPLRLPAVPDAPELSFFRRHMTPEEVRELRDIRRKLRRKALVCILPSIWLSAMGVRVIENLMNWNLDPALSPAGWLVALIMATYFPATWIRQWYVLERDEETRVVISAWTLHDDGTKDRLIEEALAESGLLWSFAGRPSLWRVTRLF